MSNLFDYLLWRGDLPMGAAPFNEVDNLILSSLSYAALDGVVPGHGAGVTVREAARRHFEAAGGWPEEKGRADFWENTERLLSALAATERFGGMMLCHYVNQIDPEKEEQFSAVTVDLGDGSAFVAFRGTDDTLVGWKENFNMGYRAQVPAQRSAVAYLAWVGAQRPGPLRTGGHSKGGNLAVYAAASSAPPLQRRLLGIYNNDGPGFGEGALDPAGYGAVRERIHTYVPQSSVVGMLLDHEERYTVVHSAQMGILQHDPYSWQVLGPGFECLETVTGSSRFVSLTLKQWIASMDTQRRERFVDALFEVLSAAGDALSPVPTLSVEWLRGAGAVLKRLTDVDEDTRHIIFQVLGQLLRCAQQSVPQMLNQGRRPAEFPPKAEGK